MKKLFYAAMFFSCISAFANSENGEVPKVKDEESKGIVCCTRNARLGPLSSTNTACVSGTGDRLQDLARACEIATAVSQAAVQALADLVKPKI